MEESDQSDRETNENEEHSQDNHHEDDDFYLFEGFNNDGAQSNEVVQEQSNSAELLAAHALLLMGQDINTTTNNGNASQPANSSESGPDSASSSPPSNTGQGQQNHGNPSRHTNLSASGPDSASGSPPNRTGQDPQNHENPSQPANSSASGPGRASSPTPNNTGQGQQAPEPPRRRGKRARPGNSLPTIGTAQSLDHGVHATEHPEDTLNQDKPTQPANSSASGPGRASSPTPNNTGQDPNPQAHAPPRRRQKRTKADNSLPNNRTAQGLDHDGQSSFASGHPEDSLAVFAQKLFEHVGFPTIPLLDLCDLGPRHEAANDLRGTLLGCLPGMMAVKAPEVPNLLETMMATMPKRQLPIVLQPASSKSQKDADNLGQTSVTKAGCAISMPMVLVNQSLPEYVTEQRRALQPDSQEAKECLERYLTAESWKEAHIPDARYMAELSERNMTPKLNRLMNSQPSTIHDFAADAKTPGSRASLLDTLLDINSNSGMEGVSQKYTYVTGAYSRATMHAEDLHTCSKNHMPSGDPGALKVWFCAPQAYHEQIRSICREEFGRIVECGHDCHFEHKNIFILPSVLKRRGIPVFCYVQQPGECVFTWPGGVHWTLSFGCTVSFADNLLTRQSDMCRALLSKSCHDVSHGTRVDYPKLSEWLRNKGFIISHNVEAGGLAITEYPQGVDFSKEKDGLLLPTTVGPKFNDIRAQSCAYDRTRFRRMVEEHKLICHPGCFCEHPTWQEVIAAHLGNEPGNLCASCGYIASSRAALRVHKSRSKDQCTLGQPTLRPKHPKSNFYCSSLNDQGVKCNKFYSSKAQHACRSHQFRKIV